MNKEVDVSQVHQDDYQRQLPANRARELAIVRLLGAALVSATLIALTVAVTRGGPPRTNRA